MPRIFSFKNDPNDALEGMLLSSALVAQEMSIAQIVCGVPGASISLSLIILLRLVSPKICENSFCDWFCTIGVVFYFSCLVVTLLSATMTCADRRRNRSVVSRRAQNHPWNSRANHRGPWLGKELALMLVFPFCQWFSCCGLWFSVSLRISFYGNGIILSLFL